MNLNEINNNLLRVIQNADSQSDFLQKFLGNPPGNVTFTNVRADGSTVNRSISTLAKFTGDVNNTINGAMNLNVYVDPDNGSDSNDGHDWANAFKTIKYAIDIAPAGSKRTIYLANDSINLIDSYINLAGRNILISGSSTHPATLKPRVFEATNAEGNTYISCGNFRSSFVTATMVIRNIIVETVEDTEDSSSIWLTPFMAIYGHFDVTVDNDGIKQFNDDSDLVTVKLHEGALACTYSGLGSITLNMRGTNITRDDESESRAKLLRIGNSTGILTLSGITLHDGITIRDLIQGIAYAGDYPRNLLTSANIVKP